MKRTHKMYFGYVNVLFTIDVHTEASFTTEVPPSVSDTYQQT